MQRVRRIIASLLTFAVIVGAMPGGLALGCVARAVPAAAPCEHGGCDKPEAPAVACVCIYYPAPQAPETLAVLAAGTAPIASAAMPAVAVAPPASLPARDDPPDPPPPR